MFLGVGKKPESLEESHVDTRQRGKLHTDRNLSTVRRECYPSLKSTYVNMKTHISHKHTFLLKLAMNHYDVLNHLDSLDVMILLFLL